MKISLDEIDVEETEGDDLERRNQQIRLTELMHTMAKTDTEQIILHAQEQNYSKQVKNYVKKKALQMQEYRMKMRYQKKILEMELYEKLKMDNEQVMKITELEEQKRMKKIQNMLSSMEDKHKLEAQMALQQLEEYKRRQKLADEERERSDRQNAERKKKIQEEAERSKNEKEKNLKEMMESQKKQEEEEDVKKLSMKQAIPLTATASTLPSLYRSEKTAEQAKYYMLKLQELEHSIQAFVNNSTLEIKNVRMNLKMRIQTKVGQISIKKQQVQLVSNDLSKLLHETVNNLMARNYCLDMMGQKFVEQGEFQVHVHQSSAFSIAYTILLICQQHGDFFDVLMGHFIRKCPYVAPMYIPREKNEPKEDYIKKIGFRQNRDGSFEKEENYNERMSGIISLYAAITQTSLQNHPQGLEFGWKWLASILNMPPRVVTPSLLLAFLQIAGYSLFQAYRNQFIKIALFIKEEYIDLLPEGCTGSKMRLQLFIEQFEKTGQIPIPEGRDLF